MTITNRVSLKSVMGGNTPIADVVDAPTIGAATAGVEAATVAYTAAATGGTATSFTAISTPGSITGTGSSPITVSGLTGGTAYTFKVYGTNASGVWSAVQSSASNSVTPLVASSYQSIATVNGTGSSNTITFSSIPQTYKHLQIRFIAKSVTSSLGGSASPLAMAFGGGSGIATHALRGDGTTVSATGLANTSSMFNLYNAIPGDRNNGSMAGMFGVGIVDILDYSSTTRNKTARVIMGVDINNAATTAIGNIQVASGFYDNTSAITDVSFTIGSGFTTSSSFALYGIKG